MTTEELFLEDQHDAEVARPRRAAAVKAAEKRHKYIDDEDGGTAADSDDEEFGRSSTPKHTVRTSRKHNSATNYIYSTSVAIESKKIPESDQDLPQFIASLYEMLSSPKHREVVQWVKLCENRYRFAVLDVKKFTSEVLTQYYRTNKMTSFMRQLNNYGFCKVKSSDGNDSTYEFEHEHDLLRPDRPELLYRIERRRALKRGNGGSGGAPSKRAKTVSSFRVTTLTAPKGPGVSQYAFKPHVTRSKKNSLKTKSMVEEKKTTTIALPRKALSEPLMPLADATSSTTNSPRDKSNNSIQTSLDRQRAALARHHGVDIVQQLDQSVATATGSSADSFHELSEDEMANLRVDQQLAQEAEVELVESASSADHYTTEALRMLPPSAAVMVEVRLPHYKTRVGLDNMLRASSGAEKMLSRTASVNDFFGLGQDVDMNDSMEMPCDSFLVDDRGFLRSSHGMF